MFRKGKNQNTLESEHVATSLDCFARFADEDGRSRVVSLDEIRSDGGSLNLAGYIARSDETEIASVKEATAALTQTLDAAWAAEDRLNQLLVDRGFA